MGQTGSTEGGLSEIIGDAVSNAALCPGILTASAASPLIASSDQAGNQPKRRDGDASLGGDDDARSVVEATDDVDDEWTTVTVADASSSAEDFLANLRKDLEGTLVAFVPTTKTPSGEHDCVPSGQAAAELSSVVPNSVLIRLALLQPFMRGASVFDTLSFEDKPASATSLSGFRLARPVVTLNGEPVDSISAFKEGLQTAAAAAVVDDGERQAVQQVVLLLVHNRFSKLCVDAGKLAFGDPSLSLAPSTVDVTCLPGRVRFVSQCALVSKRGSPTTAAAVPALPEVKASSAPSLAPCTAASHAPVTMTLAWDFAPDSAPVTAWGAVASCFSSFATAGSDDFAAQRGREAAAVVTFVGHHPAM